MNHISSILKNTQNSDASKSLHRSASVSSLTGVSVAKSQRLTVSDCLNSNQHVSEQKPSNYSKIEMLLNNSHCATKNRQSESCDLASLKKDNTHHFSRQKSMLKKKNSFINRKTIRNYTAAAAAAAAANANDSDSAGNSMKHNLAYYNHYNNSSVSLEAFAGAHQQQQQIQSMTMPSIEDNANLRLLVEVAVGLWEEQQRNYEYRN